MGQPGDFAQGVVVGYLKGGDFATLIKVFLNQVGNVFGFNRRVNSRFGKNYHQRQVTHIADLGDGGNRYFVREVQAFDGSVQGVDNLLRSVGFAFLVMGH